MDIGAGSVSPPRSHNYFCDHLRMLLNQVNYWSGNPIIQFTLSATNPVGSCTTVGLSLQSQARSITCTDGSWLPVFGCLSDGCLRGC
jgi:hypothetical protein